MGYVYSELIPPAVLLDNPGLTREEFIGKLKGVRYSENRERVRDEKGVIGDSVLKPFPLDLSGCNSRSSFMPTNEEITLYKLAGILSLPYNSEFGEKMESLVKEHELFKDGRVLEVYGEENYYGVPNLFVNYYGDPLFEVITEQEAFLTGRTQFGRFNSCSDFKDGDVVLTTDTGAHFYPFRIKRFAKDFGGEQLMEIEGIRIPIATEKFNSLIELVKEHPYFHPEFMYDFSQNQGRFNLGGLDHGQFMWENENGRYFLDWETFRNIEGTSSDENGNPNPRSMSYTDLILTAEAIRHRAWKLLSAYGLAYFDDFLRTFQGAKKRYDFAVEDAFGPHRDLVKGIISVEDFARESKSLFYES